MCSARSPIFTYKKIETAAPGFICRSSTRQGGVSTGAYASLNLGLHVGDDVAAVLENRRRFCESIDIDMNDVVWMRQVHGNKIVCVDSSNQGAGSLSMDTAIADCDGLICDQKGVFLAVGQADCMAVTAVHPQTGAFGIVHAGWRGALNKAPVALIEALRSRFGVSASSLQMAFSPAIGPKHLKLGPEWIFPFKTAFLEPENFIREVKNGYFLLDLAQCVRQQMIQAGCDFKKIDLSDKCTYENEQDFFSYRRGPQVCGRMASIAGFKK